MLSRRTAMKALAAIIPLGFLEKIYANTPYRLYRDGKVADVHQVTDGPLVKRRVYGRVTIGPR